MGQGLADEDGMRLWYLRNHSPSDTASLPKDHGAFKILETTHLMAQCHIPEDMNHPHMRFLPFHSLIYG